MRQGLFFLLLFSNSRVEPRDEISTLQGEERIMSP